MATVVNNFDNFIEYIVSAFEAEVHNVVYYGSHFLAPFYF